MATITIDKHGVATVTMGNGKVLAVPPFVAITIGGGAYPELIALADGGEWWCTDHEPGLTIGFAGDLADGETLAHSDGESVTRYGEEMLITAPGRLKAAA